MQYGCISVLASLLLSGDEKSSLCSLRTLANLSAVNPSYPLCDKAVCGKLVSFLIFCFLFFVFCFLFFVFCFLFFVFCFLFFVFCFLFFVFCFLFLF